MLRSPNPYSILTYRFTENFSNTTGGDSLRADNALDVPRYVYAAFSLIMAFLVLVCVIALVVFVRRAWLPRVYRTPTVLFNVKQTRKVIHINGRTKPPPEGSIEAIKAAAMAIEDSKGRMFDGQLGQIYLSAEFYASKHRQSHLSAPAVNKDDAIDDKNITAADNTVVVATDNKVMVSTENKEDSIIVMISDEMSM